MHEVDWIDNSDQWQSWLRPASNDPGTTGIWPALGSRRLDRFL
jgi:hypothetical protein